MLSPTREAILKDGLYPGVKWGEHDRDAHMTQKNAESNRMSGCLSSPDTPPSGAGSMSAIFAGQRPPLSAQEVERCRCTS